MSDLLLNISWAVSEYFRLQVYNLYTRLSRKYMTCIYVYSNTQENDALNLYKSYLLIRNAFIKFSNT